VKGGERRYRTPDTYAGIVVIASLSGQVARTRGARPHCSPRRAIAGRQPHAVGCRNATAATLSFPLLYEFSGEALTETRNAMVRGYVGTTVARTAIGPV